MNSKTLSIIALALALTGAGISVSQADNNPPRKQRGTMMYDDMMYGGMMYGGMMYGGMMHGGMMPGGMMYGGMMPGGMLFTQLNLTDEQFQKIHSIMISAMPQRQNMLANMPAHMADAQALLNNPTFDESKAREMISKHQVLMVDNQLNMLKAHYQAFQVLTEQQKEQFNTLMAKHIAQMQQYLQGAQQ
ncbi:MAG TPA: Spy/CpxP family protein refolding chaperone [Psychromonas sp.]